MENLQKGGEVRRGFPGLDSGYRRLWKTTKVGKVALGQLKVMASLDHRADNL